MEETKRSAGRPAGLTNRQREFARYIVESLYSNAECARKAGYAGDRRRTCQPVSEWPRLSTCRRTGQRTARRRRRYGVTLLGQLKRLDELSRGAEESGQFSAAINAEKIRSALGGLTIDRREQNHTHQLDKTVPRGDRRAAGRDSEKPPCGLYRR